MRGVLGIILLVACMSAAALAHQVNLSTARLELRSQRLVAVEVALKGSDADRLAGTHIFDEQKGLVDPAQVIASVGPIASYVGSHVSVTGVDGTPCTAGVPEVEADGDGVIVRNVLITGASPSACPASPLLTPPHPRQRRGHEGAAECKQKSYRRRRRG